MNPVIRTRQGDVRGTAARGVNVFLGIPYAMPPFGADRLRPPRRVRPWSGVRDATRVGAKPPQLRPGPEVAALVPDPAIPGEDCLNLNVWTPGPGAAGLPVMVWIPGGMFEVGSGASYNGTNFARDGVVCVTINYRVGAEGFLYLADGDANRGLLDQVAALEWVQENIAAFGGDPGNVTIFGESAGAMSVGTLLSMPRARGLFRRAIAQSGAAHNVSSVATARRIGRRLAAMLGVEPSRDALAALPPDRLVQAQTELKAELVAHPDPERWGREMVTSFLPWQPVIDGDVVPAPPLERITAGAAGGIDLIVGTNVDEHRLFLAIGGAIHRVTAEMLGPAAAAYGLPVEPALSAYRAAYPDASAGDLLAAIHTDGYWRIPAIRLADAHAGRGAATFMYEFAWPSPELDGLVGACHALEIAFVFDTLDREFAPMAGPLLGPAPPQRLADAMHAAWVSFAARGECGWPAYEPPRRATLRFDTTSRVVDDPRSTERALWEGVR